MLAQYHRWIFEHKKQQLVERLQQWVIQESEFQIVLAETLRKMGQFQYPEEKSGLVRAAAHGESLEITTPFSATSFKL